MSEQIHDVAAELSPMILAAEEAIEDATAAVATLIAGTVAKRRATGMLPAEAQPTVLILQEALSHTIRSGNMVLRAHGRFEEQYRTLANGDTHPLTREGVQNRAATTTDADRRHLSVVNG